MIGLLIDCVVLASLPAACLPCTEGQARTDTVLPAPLVATSRDATVSAAPLLATNHEPLPTIRRALAKTLPVS